MSALRGSKAGGGTYKHSERATLPEGQVLYKTLMFYDVFITTRCHQPAFIATH